MNNDNDLRAGWVDAASTDSNLSLPFLGTLAKSLVAALPAFLFFL